MINTIQLKRFIKRGIILFLLLVVPTIFFGQKHSIIKNIYPFFTERTPGMSQIDRDGKPYPTKIDTTLIVYVETTKSNIIWQNAFQNGKEYTISNYEILATPNNVGQLKNSKTPIILDVKMRNFLWQLYLAPAPISKKQPMIMKQDQLLINGSFKGRTFLKISEPPKQLDVAPSV